MQAMKPQKVARSARHSSDSPRPCLLLSAFSWPSSKGQENKHQLYSKPAGHPTDQRAESRSGCIAEGGLLRLLAVGVFEARMSDLRVVHWPDIAALALASGHIWRALIARGGNKTGGAIPLYRTTRSAQTESTGGRRITGRDRLRVTEADAGG